MSTTRIEWADMTINPIVGCSKCSPGCDNCYAEKIAAWLAKNPLTAAKYAGVVGDDGKWTGQISELFACFAKLPKLPRRIFLGSMTDMFHENISHGQIALILMEIFRCKQHTFMLLTKRPDRMSVVMHNLLNKHKPLPNVWLGVTVCNQAEADAKIPLLLQTPAAKRFISVEPMLGPVDLTTVSYPQGHIDDAQESGLLDTLRGLTMDDEPTLPALDWVICGGETGPWARAVHPDWVRSLRDQCSAASVPFFFKGWGEWYWDVDPYGYYPDPQEYTWRDLKNVPTTVYRVGKCRAGRLLDGREWNEVPS